MTRMDKCLFGVLISAILLLFLAGPFWFFSEYGGFIATNPATGGSLTVQFIVSKNTSIADVMDNSYENNPNPYDESRFNPTKFVPGAMGNGSSYKEWQQDSTELQEADAGADASNETGTGMDDTMANAKELTAEKKYRVYHTDTPFFRQYDDYYL